jgi:hypothetical protein
MSQSPERGAVPLAFWAVLVALGLWVAALSVLILIVRFP